MDPVSVALATALAFTAADWNQTTHIHDDPFRPETNVVLGQHPSQGRINRYYAAFSAGEVLLAYKLPQPYGERAMWITAGVEAGYVAHNYKVGLRVRF